MADQETIDVNEKVLESILKGKGYDVSKISSIKFEPAVGDGDNYVSKIYRITMEAVSKDGNDTRKLSLIMKKKVAMSSSPEMANRVKNLFVKEYTVYNEVLNKIKNFLPDKNQLWADCLAFRNEEEIYFEDLKASGHTLSSRLNGLDISHSLIFFKHLAKFHAASYVAIKRGEIDPEPYRKYIFLGTPTVENQVKSNEAEMMIDVIRKDWGSNWRPLANRLEKYKGSVLRDAVLKLSKFDKSRFNVLCHGDTWVNNFMFKYDSDNRPVSLKFVDFQILHYNSLAFDICYFLHTSIHWQLKQDNLDYLLENYCRTFAEVLEHHGLPDSRPTPEIIKKEIERLVMWSLSMSIRNRPIIMAPPEQAMTLSEIMQEQSVNSKKRNLYINPKYTDEMKHDLPNILDIIDSVNKQK